MSKTRHEEIIMTSRGGENGKEEEERDGDGDLTGGGGRVDDGDSAAFGDELKDVAGGGRFEFGDEFEGFN